MADHGVRSVHRASPRRRGHLVYDNRAILFARARWGKIYYHEDFEDTHKSQAFAEHLARVAAAS